ncbi:hypothetical protein [Aureimonas jatrophae]|jgi:hypothetical protein|uniref:Uncharacterized protein n=1 Tax=Aureimonas jatrophae TaxID=1166073 RepID=A0A1H0D4T1_9HYPH|nr:hypothetical protein [Aureimonas jatrophae]MBB3951707.1 hypothetical protein [Aureimonas jatrophae]SDN65148.1 hypothetical protein SAMN05192530_101599 [Aureimonas jatrophae]
MGGHAWRQERFQGAGLDELTETHVVTILVLTDRFSDGADLRDAFFAVFPQAGEDAFLNACYVALQVLSPEQSLA